MRSRNSGLLQAAFLAMVVLGPVPNSSALTRYDSLISAGRDLAYDARFVQADSLFTEASRLSPDKGESYLGIAQVRLWIYTGTKSRDDYAAFMKWSDTAIARSTKLLGNNGDDFTATYLLGQVYLLRAAAGVTARSYFDAFWAVKAAAGYFKETLKLNPAYYDAYRGLGEIHYFLSFLPGAAKWLMPLFGLEADKAKGFSEIRLAYEKGTEDRTQSAFSLAQTYSDYVAEYDSAEVIMRALVKKFPDNPMFNYHLAVVLIKEARLEDAEKYLDAVLRLDNPNFRVLNDLTVFLKGDVHFKMNDFRNSVKYNEMFIRRTSEPDYTGIANYRLAVSYRAMGNDAMMKKSLSAAMHGNQDIYDDARARYRSERFIDEGISADELFVLEMRNDVDAGRYREAYDSLGRRLHDIRDQETRAEALVVLCDAAIHLGRYAEANRFAAAADSADKGGDAWIEPRCSYLAALSNYYSGNLSAARDYLARARDSDEYKTNNILNALINNLEGKLKSGKS